jgi:hypothetical protein
MATHQPDQPALPLCHHQQRNQAHHIARRAPVVGDLALLIGHEDLADQRERETQQEDISAAAIAGLTSARAAASLPMSSVTPVSIASEVEM